MKRFVEEAGKLSGSYRNAGKAKSRCRHWKNTNVTTAIIGQKSPGIKCGVCFRQKHAEKLNKSFLTSGKHKNITQI
jgi:hypothetical protein